MAKYDPELEMHRTWLGMLQPVGLVVSPTALMQAQAVLDRNVAELQQRFLGLVLTDKDEPFFTSFARLSDVVLEWEREDLAGGPDGPEVPEDLEVVLIDEGETLRPTFAVLDPMADSESKRVVMLISELPTGVDFDKPSEPSGGGWSASPHAKLERLLREKNLAVGLLSNGRAVRLLYAPRGESSGHMTFPVKAMCEVGGRDILSAFHLLLSEHRVFGAPDGQRLPDLLAESRKYQNLVSNKLSEQVLGALWELLFGFKAASTLWEERKHYRLLPEQSDELYGGLLTVLLRLVFLLYAEDQGLMPDDEIYARNYSVAGLFERLREDAAHHPDTMDQRFGAWAGLLSLFRLVYDGGGYDGGLDGHGFQLPRRHGELFHPDAYPFLEGRTKQPVVKESFEAPRVSDGCLYRVLEKLLILDGERLSYRALDVEQIGSVYEAMMGFTIERAFGPSLALRRRHKGMNLDIVFNVEALLDEAPGKRKKWLKDQADCDLTGKAATALKKAQTRDDVVAALGRKISPWTPQVLPPDSLFLQPGEERRRSGSHYTPRELTEPIVRTTLQPVIEALGAKPRPEQILALKVCDPAMGSGAFLVETCRQLAEALVDAWTAHDKQPDLPLDEDALLHARRLVAQRCLYGVDRNPFAVSLAKLSLWLVTLAKDHPFTFLDHALKQGDSLVGLSREQILKFHWKSEEKDAGSLFENITATIDTATNWRQQIFASDEGDYGAKKHAWNQAEGAIRDVRRIGDLVIAAFFDGRTNTEREDLRRTYRNALALPEDDVQNNGKKWLDYAQDLREREKPVYPFHWGLEFPEVFSRHNPGFDAFVGNPPFMGGTMISTSLSRPYLEFLMANYEQSGSRMDLVAYFLRRSYSLLRNGGTLGVIATNTIAQGDTRRGGLQYIRAMGGLIYQVQRRYRWPGAAAAVIVSVVHIGKGIRPRACFIDGRLVEKITAYMFHQGSDRDPIRLLANQGISFTGVKHYGDGFLFEDGKDKATPLKSMYKILRQDSENSSAISPFVGGAEINDKPDHKHSRYIINFPELPFDELRKKWPELMRIVETKVRPERESKAADVAKWSWWKYWRPRKELYDAIGHLENVLGCVIHSKYLSFPLLAAGSIFSHGLTIFALGSYAAFANLQARPHELWARFFGSSMKDDPRYTPSSCFETFPFPEDWKTNPKIESIGKKYYDYRAQLMIDNNEGLTKTYNRFHDPDEYDERIHELRRLHDEMDRAVLRAYGWDDIPTKCEFLLDYEIDEDTWGNKKKPYRYRWPDDVHDTVLARLLELNQERAREEKEAARSAKTSRKITAPAKSEKKAVKSKKKKKTAEPELQLSLFDSLNEETPS